MLRTVKQNKMEQGDGFSETGGLLSVFLLLFSEHLYGSASSLMFFSEQAKDFINDTKELVGLITALVILIIYVKKAVKKDKQNGQD